MTGKLNQNKPLTKLRRPNFLDDVHVVEHNTSSVQPSPGDGFVSAPSPVAGILTAGHGTQAPATDQDGNGNGQDKAQSLKAMLDTLRNLEQYMPLEDVTGAPAADGTEQTPADLLGLEPPPRGRFQIGDATTRQAQDAVLKQVALELTTTSKVEMEAALAKIQKGLLRDLGDVAYSQSAVLLVNSATRLERLEHIFFNACAKVGLIKVNRSTRTVSIQPALKDGLLPVVQAKRLLLAALDAMKKAGTVRRSVSMEFDDEAASEEELWARANEMNVVLCGQELKPLASVRKVTLTETVRK